MMCFVVVNASHPLSLRDAVRLQFCYIQNIVAGFASIMYMWECFAPLNVCFVCLKLSQQNAPNWVLV